MISGNNSKGVNNRHVWFISITSSRKDCNEYCTFMASPYETYGGNFDWLYINIMSDIAFEQKDLEILLVGQAVLYYK